MLYLKKYFTEGLIQVAILLSLCGVRVEVGLEPYLPPSWHEMILGPTSALTQTQFHNLRNRMEDGYGLHPKSVDLDGFFTARRLLGLVHSLDRLQVPNAELETWLVQREPDSLPGGPPDQSPPLERAPTGLDRDRAGASLEPGAGLGTQGEEEENEEDIKEDGELPENLWPIGDSDQSLVVIGQPNQEVTRHQHLSDRYRYNASPDEEGEEEEELTGMCLRDGERKDERGEEWRREGGGARRSDRRGGSHDHTNNRELVHNEADQSDEVLGVDGEGADPERLSRGREPILSPLIPTDHPSLDLELQWQDLLAIMEPQGMDVDMAAVASFQGNRNPDDTLDSRPPGTLTNPDSAVQEHHHSNHNSHSNSPVIHRDVSLMEAALPGGFLGQVNHPEQEPALLPLTPSTQLDDHSSDLHARDTSENLNLHPSHSPSYHMKLLEEAHSDNFSVGLDTENGTWSTFSMNLLTRDPAEDSINITPHLQHVPSPGTHTRVDMTFHPNDLTSPGSTPPFEPNSVTRDLSATPSSFFLADDDDEEGEDGLPSTLGDLLEDAAILDEISLLDLALEEGFSPEMAARLEEEGYLDPDIAKRGSGQFDSNMADVEEEDDGQSGSITAIKEEQDHPRTHQQGGEEADSDSGLSLDFSYSPASPCTSEASSYSSSSSSSSSSSVSPVESPFSEEEEQEEEEDGATDSIMELEVTIKQEEEEEEMGAVGGSYSTDMTKIFPGGYREPELFNHLPWLEHISHDHTYNQPSACSPAPGKTVRHPRSPPRQASSKPYRRSCPEHISESKLWSRDERRARTLKVPFSNEVIVNMPVEEFNELLANYRLNEEQLALIRDIRRRGKNKMAAQNCRRRKLDVLLGLEDDVSGLRRHRTRLLREKQEALRSLQEMKRQLSGLYQEVFSSLRNEEGRPLDATEYALQFGANGGVAVTSRRQGDSKSSKKQRDKKK
ncbi:endoplasmic reticulum membrane sensor NFE2L1a [Polymixia lowei]